MEGGKKKKKHGVEEGILLTPFYLRKKEGRGEHLPQGRKN